MGLKSYKDAFVEELVRQDKEPMTGAGLKLVAVAGVLGAVTWGAVAVAAAIMLVGFGAWPWVIWPLALYCWTNHVAKVVASYAKVKKGSQKWEQNVTVNVSAPEMTAEQVAEAASRAYADDLTGYRLAGRG